MTTTYQEQSIAKNECLISILHDIIEFGKSRQLSRNEKTSAYTECLKKLANHYNNLSEALSGLYVAVTEHTSFPRHFINVPMSQYDAREFERAAGIGGIATGYNRFQGWARKYQVMFRGNLTQQAPASENNGLTDKQIVKFLKHLRKIQPLQEDIKIIMHLFHGFIVLGDKRLNGRVSREKGSSDVHIQINTDQHVNLIYKTIAHEYRHIMQWVNPGIEWFVLSNNVKCEEIDAQLFAQRIVNNYCYPKR